jgi:hypothetical protein
MTVSVGIPSRPNICVLESLSCSEWLAFPCRAAIDAVFAALKRRLDLDPSLPLDTLVTQSYTNLAVDKPDLEYLQSYASDVTIFPGGRRTPCGRLRPCFPIMADNMADGRPRSGQSKSSSKTSLTDSGDSGNDAIDNGGAVDARILDEAVATALFKTVVADGSGRASASFQAPSNMGTFVLRAYVVTPSGSYGNAESQVVVKRPVSLTPSMPRWVGWPLSTDTLWPCFIQSIVYSIDCR